MIRINVSRFLMAGLLAGFCHGQTPSLSIGGDVANPVTLTAADLAKMPRITVTLHEKNGASAVYEGVPLREILRKAGAPFGKQLRGKALASYVLASASDGYEVTYALPELDPEFKDSDKIIVADRRDGKPIEGNQGPLRIVNGDDKIPARSLRMLEKLQVVMLRK